MSVQSGILPLNNFISALYVPFVGIFPVKEVVMVSNAEETEKERERLQNRHRGAQNLGQHLYNCEFSPEI